MIYITIIAVLAAICLLGCVVGKRLKSVGNTMDEDRRAIELLAEARTMFSTAENDIDALDSLYQFTYRKLLLAVKNKSADRDDLKRDSIIIFNAKDLAIINAVRFEERYTAPIFFRKEKLCLPKN